MEYLPIGILALILIMLTVIEKIGKNKKPLFKAFLSMLMGITAHPWMLPKVVFVLTDAASPVGRQERHFYMCLFFLSKKVSNATINPPKEINKANIPRKIIIISYGVICATSLPMYSGYPVFIGLGGYHPVIGTFLFKILT